jgi:biotin carboxyl carrier protein
MENEISAHKAGVITVLAVEVGASVQAGDALVVIEDIDS